MNSYATLNPILSFPEVIQSRKPREMFEMRLIKLLKVRFKELKIIWSSEAFRGGLNNPELPAYLLKKLESLIVLAESLDWKLSKTLKNEFDITVEDIETFNPAFIKKMKRASAEIKKGNFMTHEEFIKSLES